MRALFSLIYFATFVGGLGWTNEMPIEEKVLRVPQQVEEVRTIDPQGALHLVTYGDLRDTCESFDGYAITVKGMSIVIDSYISVRRDRLCAEIYRDGLRREYFITGLDPSRVYRIYFRDVEKRLVDFGTTSFP